MGGVSSSRRCACFRVTSLRRLRVKVSSPGNISADFRLDNFEGPVGSHDDLFSSIDLLLTLTPAPTPDYS